MFYSAFVFTSIGTNLPNRFLVSQIPKNIKKQQQKKPQRSFEGTNWANEKKGNKSNLLLTAIKNYFGPEVQDKWQQNLICEGNHVYD